MGGSMRCRRRQRQVSTAPTRTFGMRRVPMRHTPLLGGILICLCLPSTVLPSMYSCHDVVNRPLTPTHLLSARLRMVLPDVGAKTPSASLSITSGAMAPTSELFFPLFGSGKPATLRDDVV